MRGSTRRMTSTSCGFFVHTICPIGGSKKIERSSGPYASTAKQLRVSSSMSVVPPRGAPTMWSRCVALFRRRSRGDINSTVSGGGGNRTAPGGRLEDEKVVRPRSCRATMYRHLPLTTSSASLGDGECDPGRHHAVHCRGRRMLVLDQRAYARSWASNWIACSKRLCARSAMRGDTLLEFSHLIAVTVSEFLS